MRAPTAILFSYENLAHPSDSEGPLFLDGHKSPIKKKNSLLKIIILYSGAYLRKTNICSFKVVFQNSILHT